MDTSSTAAIYGGLRARILNWTPVAPLAGGTLASRGFQVFSGGYAPDAAAYPYALLRLMGLVTDTAGVRERGQVEVMCFARPRNPWGAQLEVYADVIDQAFHLFTDPRSGAMVYGRGRSRDTLPPFPAPADREVVQIRLVYGITVYPTYLTAMGTSFTPSTT